MVALYLCSEVLDIIMKHYSALTYLKLYTVNNDSEFIARSGALESIQCYLQLILETELPPETL